MMNWRPLKKKQMQFNQLYSSSTGNLYMVTASNGKRLMIECGVVWSKLQKALNYDLSGIVGCLVSHEHKDHSKAVVDVMKAGINIFVSAGTLWSIESLEAEWQRRTKVIQDKTIVLLGTDFKVRAFATNHDATEPLGFAIKCDGEYLLFVTDTSHIKQRFPWPFSIIALECSYNKEYLAKKVEVGVVNETFAKRLLTSHMEEKEAMRYLTEFCDLSKCRQIHLLHMSADTINKKRVKMDFERKLFIEVRIL